MVKVYAVALVVGVVALLGWIMMRTLSANIDRASIDPEQRLGLMGRRVVAALVGFGIGGMSAEFSPRDLSWPFALVLAILGAGAAAWYAGWVDREDEDAEGSKPEPA
ncbi:MAG TPA: hypothetical protein VJ938_10410 [Acidimicrobiia bacterium]|nr:hypothetical protein [Acidimicrobiia bacterium]